MKPIKLATILLILAAPPGAIDAARAADAEAGLLSVKALGSINGQALACAEAEAAAQAKLLMLAHAPKTARFGAAFDEATRAAYLDQTHSGRPCPTAIQLTDQLNQLAPRLAAALPVAVSESN